MDKVLDLSSSLVPSLTHRVNRAFGTYREPWQVAMITTSIVLGTLWLWNLFFREDENVWVRSKREALQLAKKVPMIRRQIDGELLKIRQEFEDSMIANIGHLTYRVKLPRQGLTKNEILQLLGDHMALGRYDWRHGSVSGAVYGHRDELIELVTAVYGQTSYTNPLHPDIFPGICKMEAEVVRMCCHLFHGGTKSCGTMTSGGTESIILACKAYRDYAREIRGIWKPNIVLPKTAHAAFDKAAQFFNIHLRYVPVDPQTYEVDIKAFRRAINSRTILLVGSTPNFPYGTMDDIEAIAKLGLKKSIPVHVDACLGSFVVALSSAAGYDLNPFDFSVEGVTSISVDTHKYGLAPKGSSVIMYSEEKYRNYQYTVTTDWPGGVYGSATVNGSRAGGVIAACWATMIYIGYDGYLEATRKVLKTAHYIEEGIRAIEELFVFGQPSVTVIAMGSKVFNIYRLSTALNNRGWDLNVLQFPFGIHICVTEMHTIGNVAERFLIDLRNAVDEIMTNPHQKECGKMALYGMAQSLPDRTIVGDVTRCYLNSMYSTPIKKISNKSLLSVM